MGSEEHKEMLFWTKEEYRKFADEMMDKGISETGVSGAGIQRRFPWRYGVEPVGTVRKRKPCRCDGAAWH